MTMQDAQENQVLQNTGSCGTDNFYRKIDEIQLKEQL